MECTMNTGCWEREYFRSDLEEGEWQGVDERKFHTWMGMGKTGQVLEKY